MSDPSSEESLFKAIRGALARAEQVGLPFDHYILFIVGLRLTDIAMSLSRLARGFESDLFEIEVD